jgi:hypothetical protein
MVRAGIVLLKKDRCGGGVDRGLSRILVLLAENGSFEGRGSFEV